MEKKCNKCLVKTCATTIVEGKRYFRKYCRSCCKKVYNEKTRYRKSLKSSCEFCGFIPVVSFQLDVDHIDGNHKNDNLNNLQTLCANCHRLKTFLQRKLS